MNPYDAHVEAVAHAASEIDRLMTDITHAALTAERALAAVLLATGDGPRNVNAREALSLTQQSLDSLKHRAQLCNAIGQHLNNYLEAF